MDVFWSLCLMALLSVWRLARIVPLQKTVYLSILKKELPKLVQKRGTISQISLQNIVSALTCYVQWVMLRCCHDSSLNEFQDIVAPSYELTQWLTNLSGKSLPSLGRDRSNLLFDINMGFSIGTSSPHHRRWMSMSWILHIQIFHCLVREGFGPFSWVFPEK